MGIDLNYHAPLGQREMTAKILEQLPKINKSLTKEARKEISNILINARANGRESVLNLRDDNNWNARHYQQGFLNYVKEKVHELELSPEQISLTEDIAVLSYRTGTQNPDTKKQPESFNEILNLLN